MLKFNLNELKQFKAIALYSEGYEYIFDKDDYIPDIYYFCGFIEHIYAKDGAIVFKVYGAGYPYCEKIIHTELKINMKEIDVYEKKIEDANGICAECINIHTNYECNLLKSRYFSKSVIKIIKNLDFRFLMRKFYEVVPPYDICLIESSMLMDKSILRLVNIPKDYEFAQY